ncbi:MAG: hypothetical protein AAFY76_11365, partial [Cyanobacteria bacterium J06649_11]
MSTRKKPKKKATNLKYSSTPLLQRASKYAPYCLITVIFASIYFYSFDSKLSLNGDNASYYLLGKSIHMGAGYNLYSDLYAKPHSHFPPGYPLLIAIGMLID